MSRSRLLVALLVPGPAGTEVDGVRRALGDRALGRVPPHVTLVPPINVAADRMPDAFEIVRSAAAAGSPLHLRLGPAATFMPRNPVVYLAVGGDVEPVAALRAAVWAGPWARKEALPFVPHVTVAGRMEPELIEPTVRALAHYEAEVTVDRVHVLRESVEDDEPRRVWTVIGDAPLGGPRVVGRGGVEIAVAVGDTLDPDARRFFDTAWAAHLLSSYGPLPGVEPWVVTARTERRVVGVATGTSDDELWIDRLVVDPGDRGHGIGSQLLIEAELLGARRGCERGRLVCQATSPAAAWYRSRLVGAMTPTAS